MFSMYLLGHEKLEKNLIHVELRKRRMRKKEGIKGKKKLMGRIWEGQNCEKCRDKERRYCLEAIFNSFNLEAKNR